MLLERMRLVDLFCGTGGFARGAERAGLRVAVAVDNSAVLTSSHRDNFPNTRLLLRDIAGLTGEELEQEAGGSIDGIFGGPPCQGFSSIGRRDPSDERRKLLRDFFRLVKEAQPTFFVMENVRGLLEGTGKGELEDALRLVASDYNLLGPHIWDARDFGAATTRRRAFVIGVHKSRDRVVRPEDVDAQRRAPANVYDAISDIEGAQFVGVDGAGFDVWRAPDLPTIQPYARSLRSSTGLFTGHRVTAHTDGVVDRFSLVPQGGVDAVGRHQRLHWDLQCPTLRAGTGSDKGSYQSVRPIHPTHHRVITVREAARLQGFPDGHRFHPTVWHSFRMIGNSVAPVMAEAIFRAVLGALSDSETRPLVRAPQMAG